MSYQSSDLPPKIPSDSNSPTSSSSAPASTRLSSSSSQHIRTDAFSTSSKVNLKDKSQEEGGGRGGGSKKEEGEKAEGGGKTKQQLDLKQHEDPLPSPPSSNDPTPTQVDIPTFTLTPSSPVVSKTSTTFSTHGKGSSLPLVGSTQVQPPPSLPSAQTTIATSTSTSSTSSTRIVSPSSSTSITSAPFVAKEIQQPVVVVDSNPVQALAPSPLVNIATPLLSVVGARGLDGDTEGEGSGGLQAGERGQEGVEMKSSGLGAEIVVVVEEDMVGATKTRLRTLVLGLVEGNPLERRRFSMEYDSNKYFDLCQLLHSQQSGDISIDERVFPEDGKMVGDFCYEEVNRSDMHHKGYDLSHQPFPAGLLWFSLHPPSFASTPSLLELANAAPLAPLWTILESSSPIFKAARTPISQDTPPQVTREFILPFSLPLRPARPLAQSTGGEASSTNEEERSFYDDLEHASPVDFRTESKEEREARFVCWRWTLLRLMFDAGEDPLEKTNCCPEKRHVPNSIAYVDLCFSLSSNGGTEKYGCREMVPSLQPAFSNFVVDEYSDWFANQLKQPSHPAATLCISVGGGKASEEFGALGSGLGLGLTMNEDSRAVQERRTELDSTPSTSTLSGRPSSAATDMEHLWELKRELATKEANLFSRISAAVAFIRQAVREADIRRNLRLQELSQSASTTAAAAPPPFTSTQAESSSSSAPRKEEEEAEDGEVPVGKKVWKGKGREGDEEARRQVALD